MGERVSRLMTGAAMDAQPGLPGLEPMPARDARRDCAAIVLVALVIALALRPFQNTPFIDDWVYSWSVQHLLETGEFLFPELVGNPIVTQVLWGALFSLPFGFSLGALRVSTWVLGVLAVCALYLLIRECGGTRRSALIGAAALGFCPTFFILAPTFMTDVPFIAGMLWAVLMFVRGIGRRRVAFVWVASAVCALSVGSRIIGVGTAAAMVATLLLHTGRWGRRVHVLLAPALVAPFAVSLFVWTRERTFRSADITWLPNGPQQRQANLVYALGADLLPAMLVATLLLTIVLVGIALIPIACGLARKAILRRAVWVFIVCAVGWIAAAWGGYYAWVPFEPGNIWALREIGAAASFVPGWQPEPLSWWAALAAVVAALASTAVLIAAWPGGAVGTAERFLFWNIAAQMLLIAILWLTADRYVLVLVPLATALVLSRQPLARSWPTILGIGACAAIALVGTRDHLAYHRAVWSAVADLRASGAQPRDIDGGYVVNGWLQYLHPDEAYRDPSGRIIVPMVNDFAELTYQISNAQAPNRTVVRRYPYSGWLGRDGVIYVLR
jgi:hypothetical protein